MEIKRAKMMAIDLMTYYGLNGWYFTFDNAYRRHGLCRPRTKTISLSKIATKLNGEDIVLNTILHEIAHALTPRSHHGSEWRRKALEIGCNGERCVTSDAIQAPHKFNGVCPNCGHTTKAFRRRNSACASCCNKFNRGKYDAKYSFQWSQA